MTFEKLINRLIEIVSNYRLSHKLHRLRKMINNHKKAPQLIQRKKIKTHKWSKRKLRSKRNQHRLINQRQPKMIKYQTRLTVIKIRSKKQIEVQLSQTKRLNRLMMASKLKTLWIKCGCCTILSQMEILIKLKRKISLMKLWSNLERVNCQISCSLISCLYSMTKMAKAL